MIVLSHLTAKVEMMHEATGARAANRTRPHPAPNARRSFPRACPCLQAPCCAVSSFARLPLRVLGLLLMRRRCAYYSKACIALDTT